MIEDNSKRQEQLKSMKEKYSSEDVLSLVLAVLDDKQAIEPKCFRIDEVSSLGDYAVVASSTSSTQQRVMAETMRRAAKASHYELLNVGQPDDETWTILDFGSVICHLLSGEGREHYHLEDLYKEGEVIETEEFLKENPCDLSS